MAAARLAPMWAYALTIFAGAFLLFQVQPLMGKFVLPWFGGGPGVWTTCLLFFQTALLGGYAYAHWTSRYLKARRQVALHLGLLLAALALLPIVPGDFWKPRAAGSPVLQILVLLTVSVGMPYFILATTGPLLQRWFSRTHPGASSYRLYALSNAGSLLALLTYPIYFETHFTRRVQAGLWAGGLVLYAIGCAACALRLWQKSGSQNPDLSKPGGETAAAVPAFAPLLWLLLPACASLLLMATTNKLCLDVAVVPFLWIGPLALYLLSFIICFDSPRWYRRLPFTVLLAAALGGVCWALPHSSDWPLWKQIAVYCGGLFICCMVCHGEVYRLRPAPERLTAFYLAVAAGGALGGLFVAVVAPLIFRNYYELHWGLFVCGLLCLVVWVSSPPRRRSEANDPKPGPDPPSETAGDRVNLVSFGLRSLVSLLIVVGLIFLGRNLWRQARKTEEGAVFSSRNFYGVLTVFEYRKDEPKDHYYLLLHGRITHGIQFVDPHMALKPVSYYAEGSGVDLAWNVLPAGPRRLGVVGLGTGTLAAYPRKGDFVRFYEINPEVKRLATSRFTYVSNCLGQVEITMGDARLSMERQPQQQFDLLALDAFSSDAIPVHLLTREAFELYGRHLNTNGIIAVHISNHFLDLEPVVANLAREFKYKMAVIVYDESEDEWWRYASTWVLLTRKEGCLNSPEITAAADPVRTKDPKVPLWTDDFASLYQILKKTAD